MTSIDDLSFSIDDAMPHQRTAYRAMVRGLLVSVDDGAERYTISDISACGCSIQNLPASFFEGRIIRLQLEARGVPLVSGVEAKIVRLKDDGSTACAFQSLQRQQELALDKLVLEIQKVLISQKKI